MKRQTAIGRPASLEPLESRFCLSSPHGGDFLHDGGGAGAPATGTGSGGHALHHGQPTQGTQMNSTLAAQPRHDSAMSDFGMPRAHRLIVRTSNFVFVITLPPGYFPPMFDAPPMNEVGPMPSDGASAATARGSAAHGAVTAQQVQPPARAAAEVGVADGSANASAEASDAGELLAATDSSAGGHGFVLATATPATAPAAMSLAATAGSVIDRLTSPWHDGSTAGEVASAIVTERPAAEAIVAAAIDAATSFFAPVAEAAASVASAIAPTAVAAYEIAHMGSPFALLADSVANFVEESATVSNVVAQARSRGPWLLTASVIAADVVILTYVYRRKSTRRGAQLAPVGVA